jgi:hypothetical protein
MSTETQIDSVKRAAEQVLGEMQSTGILRGSEFSAQMAHDVTTDSRGFLTPSPFRTQEENERTGRGSPTGELWHVWELYWQARAADSLMEKATPTKVTMEIDENFNVTACELEEP